MNHKLKFPAHCRRFRFITGLGLNGLVQFKFIVLFMFVFVSSSIAQTPTNLEWFSSLIDSAVTLISAKLPLDSGEIFFNTNATNPFPFFDNKILQILKRNNIPVTLNPQNAKNSLRIVIEKAGVKYSDSFRDGLFGEDKVKRELTLKGNYVIAINGSLKSADNFSFAVQDTVSRLVIKEIEEPALPFTKAEMPPEPFFANLLEPVVALGSAAIVVYLFFSVRSK